MFVLDRIAVSGRFFTVGGCKEIVRTIILFVSAKVCLSNNPNRSTIERTAQFMFPILMNISSSQGRSHGRQKEPRLRGAAAPDHTQSTSGERPRQCGRALRETGHQLVDGSPRSRRARSAWAGHAPLRRGASFRRRRRWAGGCRRSFRGCKVTHSPSGGGARERPGAAVCQHQLNCARSHQILGRPRRHGGHQ